MVSQVLSSININVVIPTGTKARERCDAEQNKPLHGTERKSLEPGGLSPLSAAEEVTAGVAHRYHGRQGFVLFTMRAWSLFREVAGRPSASRWTDPCGR